MDRGEGIIRWSPSQARDEFLTLEINYRVIQLYKATGYALPKRFEYQPTSTHTNFQSVTAFDWSPKVGGLVALGGKSGEVQLLRIDDSSNDCITIPLKLQRTCQAVAFNTTGLLAVGLDRVRNDQCLQIWDVDQRLSKWDPSKKGWQCPSTILFEPAQKLEPSVSVTSVKFFEDQPQTLVVGIKNQSVRIHDLRDPNGAVITFQSRCNNNLAIDHADTNYFASSALDQPSVMVWDRRAISRQSASKIYLDSVDNGELPFGCALKLSHVISHRNESYIRSLRYCRDRPGLLAVLSSAGELQVICTQREFTEPFYGNDSDDIPELLEVRESFPLQYPYFDENFGCAHGDRIVSSDWAALGSPDLQPRVVARRWNQNLEVILMPTTTQALAFDLINFSAKARHREYTTFPKFVDPKEAESVLGSIALTEAQSIAESLSSTKPAHKVRASSINAHAQNYLAMALGWVPSPPSKADTTRKFDGVKKPINSTKSQAGDVSEVKIRELLLSAKRPSSSREQHELSHLAALESSSFAYAKGNNLLLHRSKQGYLFNCEKNRGILSDDPWLQDIWGWIEDAEKIASCDGMVSGSLDLRYMGVCNIWENNLGNKAHSRVLGAAVPLNALDWERAIENINKRALRGRFEGVRTDKPHHRQLCLAICGWGRSTSELDKSIEDLESKGQYTKAAAWALYESAPQRAVEILKRAGKDLLFIGLALDLQSKGTQAIERKDWDSALQHHPQIIADPYLRAIYALISTGDWKAIADENSLPMRDRVGIAMRNLDDVELTNWLRRQMIETVKTGDIEGIVLAGITDRMVDILAKYVEKFSDFQTATLIMSYAAPLYVNDYRTSQWRAEYHDLLNMNRLHIDRAKFDVQSTRKSQQRDGIAVIKLPPQQVTLRCVRCDTALTNDVSNTANPSTSNASIAASRDRNPLYLTGVNAGISCPKCGRHLGRCAVCLQTLGMPRSNRPELLTEKKNAMANFMTFCLKCDHACHADHSRAWFARHNECPASDCRCACNDMDIKIKAAYDAVRESGRDVSRATIPDEGNGKVDGDD